MKKAEKTNKIAAPFETKLEDFDHLDSEKLKKALKKEKKRLEKQEDLADDRKRPYNSLGGKKTDDITVEEIEAYRLKKTKFEDPMNQMH